MQTRLHDGVDPARVGEEKIAAQLIEGIRAAEERSRLQQRVPQERLIEDRRVDRGASPLDHRRVPAVVVGVRVSGEDGGYLAAQLLADDLERALRARLVQAGVDEHIAAI